MDDERIWDPEYTLTENGALTEATTGSFCLDLFSTAGALRAASEAELLARFMAAWNEDRDLAMRILFFGRDARGGLGERRFFRTVLGHLAWVAPESVKKNLALIPEYGRWDDLLSLFGTPCEKEALALMRQQFTADLTALKTGGAPSLLGKWLPSVNASSAKTAAAGKKVARAFGLRPAEYRKALSMLRAKIHIIENNLRTADYSFDYAAQPSRAMHKYSAAFLRNDSARYRAFLTRVNEGAAHMNAQHIMPYELVLPYMRQDSLFSNGSERIDRDRLLLNAKWASMPDFGGGENALAVVDTSSSMYWNNAYPAAVALSLGMYFADRNRGAFHGKLIEFSSSPRVVCLEGETFADRLQYALTLEAYGSTNIEAMFDLVLNEAISCGARPGEMPEKLVIISDMEFDACIRCPWKTNYRNAKARYAAHGYRLPDLVFWNAESRSRQQPVRMSDDGVMLVSGVTPRLFSLVAGKLDNPYDMMLRVLGGERYAGIAA